MRDFLKILTLVFLMAMLPVSCGDDDDDNDNNDDDAADDDDDNDDNNDDDTAPPATMGYYSESEGFDYARVKLQLPVFAENNLILFLAMEDGDQGDPELAGLLSEARALGVPVKAWIVLSTDDGYWPSEINVEPFTEAVLDFADWFEASDFGVEWFVVDMELDWHSTWQLFDWLENGDFLNALGLFVGNYDPDAFTAASIAYQELVDELSDRGFKTTVVTYPQVLDDMEDEDTVIQDVLNVPVSTVEWDEVSTMVYTTQFANLSGLEFGPWVVYDYALSTVEMFGKEKASIALGLNREMDDPAVLAAEVAAARAAGIENIQIFALEGAMEKADPLKWHAAFHAPAETPEPDGSTDTFRGIIRLLDRIF
jgi:hypothetical protein